MTVIENTLPCVAEETFTSRHNVPLYAAAPEPMSGSGKFYYQNGATYGELACILSFDIEVRFSRLPLYSWKGDMLLIEQTDLK